MRAVRKFRYRLRRLRQTITDFDNGWSILRATASGSEEIRFRRDGVTITTPNAPGARVPVYEVFCEDEYSLEWFGAGLGDEPVVLDIGAHIGCFAVDLATRVPGARIASYEPTPSTGAYLARNVEDNGLGGRVTVHRRAVGAVDGELTMADNGPGSGHNGVMHLGESGATAITVACTAFTEALSAVGGRADLVKMDTEGAEYDIVLNTPAEQWAGVRRLVMEYHPTDGHTFEQLRDRLTEVGLSLVRRDEGGPGIGLAWFSRDELAAA